MRSEGVFDENNRHFLTERKPFRYDAKLLGTKKHRVVKGDNLWTLAFKFYDPIPNAEHLYFVICEFQPDPILDPSLDLEVNRILHIPSPRVVQEKVLGAF